MASRTHPTYYTNPAFCQQSEYLNGKHPQRALSPHRNERQPPVGAQTPLRILDISVDKPNSSGEYEEQEFYEEVLVDDTGLITDKKFVVVAQNNEGKKYLQLPQNELSQGSRYGIPQQLTNSRYEAVSNVGKDRYEYIPMQEHESVSQKRQQYNEDIQANSGKVHRYATIDSVEEETDLSVNKGRYALVPVEDLKYHTKNSGRYEYIQDNSPKNQYEEPRKPTRSQSFKETRKPTQNLQRYEYIQPEQQIKIRMPERYEYIQKAPQVIHQTQQRVLPQRTGNPIATQKLHELLSTPKKQKVMSPLVNSNQTPQKLLSPQSQRRIAHTPTSPMIHQNDPFITPKKQTRTPVAIAHSSKAQQKLNYAIGTRQNASSDKRNTAIIAPICSSPVQSIYSETTYSNKTESWMNLSMVSKKPVQATLAFAAIMLVLCGSVTSGLCFYMISNVGRLYYLDFGLFSGFVCLILGILGFRSRNCYWLPNRNYISGYIVLSFFSLSTCAGLLVLLFMRPRQGTPLADITSGAVCGISVLSLMLASTGVVASYCCKYPPPDNRVQHCSPSFTV